jgi:acetoin utilization deacetylase AcuC-like enzyme
LTQKTDIGIVYHPDFLLHTQDYHPEKKERLLAILTLLKEEKLFDRLEQLAPVPAEPEEIALVHTDGYISHVRDMCERKRAYLDPDTYLTPDSYRVALLSAGAALTAMRAVMKGRLKVCYSLCRPPGHHAEPHRGMGFCLFNNIAIAARAAMREFGLERILLVDWDVHHGNGTQAAFYSDPRVLFICVHQSPAYPGSGYTDETGSGEGVGYTVNVPLPHGCGDAEYSAFFDGVVTPLADAYRPQLVMLSAGQDAYHDDPLAGMRLTFAGYAAMARKLKTVAEKHCDGKIVVCMEGGYNLKGQAEAVVTTLAELGGWDRPVKTENVPSSTKKEALALIAGVKEQSLALLAGKQL